MSLSKRVVILGTGPSGMSVAWGLAGKSNIEVTLLESAESVGGLAKTVEHRGIRFDIGPHRLSPQLPGIVEAVRALLGPDLLEKENIHGVYFHGNFYHYPPGLKDFLNLSSIKSTLVFGTSWMWARFADVVKSALGRPRDKSFDGILVRYFGKSFRDTIIAPMIKKVWGTKDLHSEFASIRFDLPTFSRMIRRIFSKKARSDNAVFYYPARGFGQIWDVLEGHLKKNGQAVELGVDIDSIEAGSLQGPFKIHYSKDGTKKTVEADLLVSSISNKSLIGYLSGTRLVEPLLERSENFTTRTLRLGVMEVKNFHLPARVIIFPEEKFVFNRVSEMNLFSDLGYPEGRSVLMLDVICDRHSEYDLMADDEFNRLVRDSFLRLGWLKAEDICRSFNMRFPGAYPVLDKTRYSAQEAVDGYFADTAVILCGREASSDYNNAHNAIGKGFLAARYIAGEIGQKQYRHTSALVGRLPIQD